MYLPRANLGSRLEVQLDDIRDLLIADIYDTSSSVKMIRFPSGVVTTSQTVSLAVAVSPSIPPMSILQPAMDLKNGI